MTGVASASLVNGLLPWMLSNGVGYYTVNSGSVVAASLSLVTTVNNLPSSGVGNYNITTATSSLTANRAASSVRLPLTNGGTLDLGAFSLTLNGMQPGFSSGSSTIPLRISCCSI